MLQVAKALTTCSSKPSRTVAKPPGVPWDSARFDVQLMGGIFLHQGNIAEMKTGEGKTLVATFPAYLNALTGRNVHVVTVNDYLAKRDAEWMGKVYSALGMTTGVVLPAATRGREEGCLRRRHYLRDEQRARLRLPARQHEVGTRADQPARPLLRDRRRGGLDPDRRGTDPAHHLGTQPGPFRSSTGQSTRSFPR